MELIRLLLKIVIVLKGCAITPIYTQDFLVNPYVVRGPFTLLPDDKPGPPLTTAESKQQHDERNTVTPYAAASDGDSRDVGYSVSPIHYKFRLRPIFDPLDDEASRFTIPSSADILIECTKATSRIVLNTVLINIDTTSVRVVPTKGTNTQPLKLKSHTLDEVSSEYVIDLVEELTVGELYEIHIDYVARVFRDRLTGVYLSNYTDPVSNETKYLVASHFEPKDARQVFPCFDYPDQKATFEISIGRREKYNTLSNMETYKTEPIQGLDGWYWDHYNTTAVKMSSYLVALVVSEYTSETADSALFHGKPVRVWGAPHEIAAGGGVLGANVAARILQFYESYFDIEYPLPKLDSASIPHFGAGAMENWGLNTYRPAYLLHYPGKTTERERLDITATIAHELAHQWFGDLVTCKSWSQIYLNEGFASYVENLGVQAVSPEYEIWNMFSTSRLQVALLNDQVAETSHPIVNDTNWDFAYFDRITYAKGSSVIRMMEDFLGEKVLQAGLRAYLKKFALGNTHQNDLYSTLHDVALQFDSSLSNSNTNLRDIMDTWTLQKGYPLIRVKVADTGLILTQEPFVYKETIAMNSSTQAEENALASADSAAQRWWVPLRIASDEKQSELFWISSASETRMYYDQDLDIPNRKWVMLNPSATGFYRVLYDDELLARIQQQLSLDHSVLTPSARAQFIDDYFTLAFSNYVHINKALDFTLYLGEEIEYSVWTTVYSNFRRTLRLLGKTEAYTKLQTYLTTRVNLALNKLGYEHQPDEKGTKVLARSHLLGFAIVLEDETALQYMGRLFDAWTRDPVNNKIPTDLQAAVLCGNLKVKGAAAWEPVYKFYTDEVSNPTTSVTRKQALLAALSCTKNKNLLSRLLQETMNPTDLMAAGFSRKNVKRSFEHFASASPAAREVLLDFLYEKTYDTNRVVDSDEDDASKKIATPETAQVPLVDIITTLSYYFHSQVDLRQMENIVNTYNEGMKGMEHHDPALYEKNQKKVNASVQRIRNNHEWIAQFYDPIYSWLRNHVTNHIRL